MNKNIGLMNLNEYLESNDQSKMINEGFKNYFLVQKKESELQRKPKEFWEKQMKDFLNKPITC